jgi:hypothetical protein
MDKKYVELLEKQIDILQSVLEYRLIDSEGELYTLYGSLEISNSQTTQVIMQRVFGTYDHHLMAKTDLYRALEFFRTKYYQDRSEFEKMVVDDLQPLPTFVDKSIDKIVDDFDGDECIKRWNNKRFDGDIFMHIQIQVVKTKLNTFLQGLWKEEGVSHT